jgi:hypothetical protein
MYNADTTNDPASSRPQRLLQAATGMSCGATRRIIPLPCKRLQMQPLNIVAKSHALALRFLCRAGKITGTALHHTKQCNPLTHCQKLRCNTLRYPAAACNYCTCQSNAGSCRATQTHNPASTADAVGHFQLLSTFSSCDASVGGLYAPMHTLHQSTAVHTHRTTLAAPLLCAVSHVDAFSQAMLNSTPPPEGACNLSRYTRDTR